jgi:hypothetical protein
MKKFFRKSDVRALESLYNRFTQIILNIEERHNLDGEDQSLWSTNAEVSEEFQRIGEQIHNAFFDIGELWSLAETENKKGTSKEDWEALNNYSDDD